jgi:hypothetical protein
MARHPERPTGHPHNPEKRLAAASRKGRRVVRTLAQATLLAAGLAAAQVPEMDSRYQMFDRTLVDRLEAPITRHHE